jgi:hypothetical protein
MVRAVLRVTWLGSVVAVLAIVGSWPMLADGALGLNGPTGEPLPWTLAMVVGLGGAAFVIRALLKLRPRRVARRAR